MRKLLSIIGLACVFAVQAQTPATTFDGVTEQQLQKKLAESEARVESKIVKSLEKTFQLQLKKNTDAFQKKIDNLSYVNTKQAQKIESQEATIAALENQIRSMGGDLTQLQKDNTAQNNSIQSVESSFSDLEASTDERVGAIESEISSITIFWMIAIAVVIVLGAVLFVGLNKKVNSAKETIDHKLKKTEDIIKEDGWDRFHDKLVQFLAMRKS